MKTLSRLKAVNCHMTAMSGTRSHLLSSSAGDATRGLKEAARFKT
ncbi:hypothetical protein ACHMW7_04710 [Aminobacter sp. UC22_36]